MKKWKKIIRVGNGLDKVDMGPIVSSKERDRYENVLHKALDEGAKAVEGGGRLSQFNKGDGLLHQLCWLIAMMK